MAKKKHAKRRGLGFVIFMVVYTAVLLGGIAYGLNWLWGCMEAYEASRPYIAIDAYMDNVTQDYILDRSREVLEGVDSNIQTPEECEDLLREALKEDITYARKASACSESKQVYVVRCGKQVVGSFTIETTEPDEYGFTPWTFTQESYDLSYLMGSETVTVLAPEGYPVYVGGTQLDESYIVSQEVTPLELFEDYYEDYDLPRFVLNTYQVGPFLGQTPEVMVLDPEGQSFIYDESFDLDTLIPACDPETNRELEAFIEEFLDIYVIFAGCANDDRYTNYNRVIQYVVRDTSLAKRMREALDGMQYAQSRGDEVDSVLIHHLVELEQGRYLCDVTYLVNTTGREGVVQTTTNTHLILVRSGDKLLVESMANY